MVVKGGGGVKYFVTYTLFFADTDKIAYDQKEYVETFNFFPTREDINDVGLELVANYNAYAFTASRGKRNYDGEWIDYE